MHAAVYEIQSYTDYNIISSSFCEAPRSTLFKMRLVNITTEVGFVSADFFFCTFVEGAFNAVFDFYEKLTINPA